MRVRVFETDDPNSDPDTGLGAVRDVKLGADGASPEQILQLLCSQFPGKRLYVFNGQDQELPGWEEVTRANAGDVPNFLAHRKQIKAVQGGQDDYATKKELQTVKARLQELYIAQNRSQQTSRTEQEIGESYQEVMTTATDFPFLVPVVEGDWRLQKAQAAVLDAFPGCTATGSTFVRAAGSAKRMRSLEEQEEQQPHAGSAGQSSTRGERPELRLPGHSLLDLIGSRNDLREEDHMQPVVMKLLHAAARALNSSSFLEDTHSASCRMTFPNNQPDVTCLAERGIRSWTLAVWTGEFKLGSTPGDINTAVGQEIKRTRFTFDAQDDKRQYAVALILTLNSLELLWVQKQEQGGIVVKSTRQLPFSISMESSGFRWLVRLLLTPNDQLGYLKPAVPQLSQLGQIAVSDLVLIRKGTAAGSGSFVWRCHAAVGKAVIKLNRDDRESGLLQKLVGVPHVIQLKAFGMCSYLGDNWHAVLVQPFVTLLTPADTLQLVGQVAYDVAQGIDGCAQRGIAQRDTTERNMGYDEAGRGYLLDFSAGKFVAGNDWIVGAPADSPKGSDVRKITGTLIAAPLSVLRGEPHRVSSMLEGVFLSILSIACNGKICGHDLTSENIARWEVTRAGALQRLQLVEEDGIASQLKPLVHALHDLFFPLPLESSSKSRGYRTNVAVSEFQAACQSACENQLLGHSALPPS